MTETNYRQSRRAQPTKEKEEAYELARNVRGRAEDLYDAGKQLLKALPNMAKAAEHEELKAAFEAHLDETQNSHPLAPGRSFRSFWRDS